MKLKTLILLERGMSMGYGSMTSNDVKLRPYPGSADDIEDWNGVTEGNGWFCYKESNDWNLNTSGATVYITEGEPRKYWMKIKTKWLRKPNDTNESYRKRVRKHVDKVTRAWVTTAKRLHNNPELNEVGNLIQITWSEAFQAALNDAKVKPYLADCGETKKSNDIVDPVNFSPRLNENMKNIADDISYSAVVLDEKSHRKLLSIFQDFTPYNWKTSAHHMTIKLGTLPPNKKDEIGKTVTLTATAIGTSEKAMAIKVEGYWTVNKIPHVTIAVNVLSGGKPVHSNNITNWKDLPTKFQLTGIVQELPR